jgi:NADH dehydrogenase [ubiquinone] 1 alpha subcomplex assembly factor 7
MKTRTVQDVLRESIREQGCISFYEFMDIALYHNLGYYQRCVAIGREGADFYTSAQSRLFSATLGRYVARCWKDFGEPSALQVVELGAGQGELALGVCRALEQRLPTSVQWSYCIVDVSHKLRAIQQASARDAKWGSRIRWSNPQPDVPTVLIANEVLDALPVERLRRTGTGPRDWERAHVCESKDGAFCWMWAAASDELAALAARWLPIQPGQIAEIAPDVASFFARCCTYGTPIKAVFFDYGISTQEWSEGVRPNGTLRAFSQHRIVHPLENPGDVDLTADVHWDYVVHAARLSGCRCATLLPQGNFLLREGIAEELQARADAAAPGQYTRWVGEFKQLVLPGGMGERFCVLECEW